MKKLSLLLMFQLCLIVATNAQIKTPAASPKSDLVQMVGLTEMTVDYSRPSMKDRVIFGELVPYDAMWRTGANAATKIGFSTDVVVNGKELKKGKYALYTKPGKSNWTIYFYDETSNWGLPKEWDENKVAASFDVNSVKLPLSFETFLINVSNLTNNSADLQLVWENTLIPIKIEVPTKSAVEADIASVMSGPSARDYYNAASFYLDENYNMTEAYEYITKAVSMEEKFWMYRKKALIEANLGKYKEAIKSAEKSMALAKAAGNDDYVRSNTASIAEWKLK